MEQEEAITQKFNDAMNYEAANITFSKNAAG